MNIEMTKLNLNIPAHTQARLDRLSHYHGLSQAEILEKALLTLETDLLVEWSGDKACDYYDLKLTEKK